MQIKDTEDYLVDKRNEILWSLAKQGYTAAQISRLFGMPKSTAHLIVSRLPDGWLSPWVKRK